jgi:hypothetical protein
MNSIYLSLDFHLTPQLRRRLGPHRLDEFPVGYSWRQLGCWPEPLQVSWIAICCGSLYRRLASAVATMVLQDADLLANKLFP